MLVSGTAGTKRVVDRRPIFEGRMGRGVTKVNNAQQEYTVGTQQGLVVWEVMQRTGFLLTRKSSPAVDKEVVEGCRSSLGSGVGMYHVCRGSSGLSLMHAAASCKYAANVPGSFQCDTGKERRMENWEMERNEER